MYLNKTWRNTTPTKIIVKNVIIGVNNFSK